MQGCPSICWEIQQLDANGCWSCHKIYNDEQLARKKAAAAEITYEKPMRVMQIMREIIEVYDQQPETKRTQEKE